MVSPLSTRTRVIELINLQRDRGRSGRIAVKVTGSPTRRSSTPSTKRARRVEIRLEVRTLCSLRPGVAGLSENITVHRPGGEFPRALGGSSSSARPVSRSSRPGSVRPTSWKRNLDRRVEVQVPIESRTLQQELLEAFEVTWRDDLFTWVLGTDRRWRRLQPVNKLLGPERVQTAGVAPVSGSRLGASPFSLRHMSVAYEMPRRESGSRSL